MTSVTSILTIRASGVRLRLEISEPAACYVFFTSALLSNRYNFVKMIAAKIFMGIIFVENLVRSIFGDLTFFSKSHISRDNREKVRYFEFTYRPPPQKGTDLAAMDFFGTTWGRD